MNFYSLLKRWQHQGLDDNCTHFADGDLLKLKAQPGNAFPTSDVASVEVKPKIQQVNLTFCGLYGVDSPLPPHVNNLTLYDNQESQSLREFLDIFNHRIYVLYFLAWKYFNVEFATELADQSFNQLVSSLIPHANLANDYSYRKSLTMKHDFLNPRELAQLVKNHFGFYHVKVLENQLQRVKLDCPKLSSKSSFSLGDNAVLSGIGFSKMDKLHIIVKINNLTQYRDALKSGSDCLSRFIQDCLPSHYTFCLTLALHTLATRIPLGSAQLQLGVNAQLGQSSPLYSQVTYDSDSP